MAGVGDSNRARARLGFWRSEAEDRQRVPALCVMLTPKDKTRDYVVYNGVTEQTDEEAVNVLLEVVHTIKDRIAAKAKGYVGG